MPSGSLMRRTVSRAEAVWKVLSWCVRLRLRLDRWASGRQSASLGLSTTRTSTEGGTNGCCDRIAQRGAGDDWWTTRRVGAAGGCGGVLEPGDDRSHRLRELRA